MCSSAVLVIKTVLYFHAHSECSEVISGVLAVIRSLFQGI